MGDKFESICHGAARGMNLRRHVRFNGFDR